MEKHHKLNRFSNNLIRTEGTTLGDSNKKIDTYTKDMLIRQIAKKYKKEINPSKVHIEEVKNVINLLEEEIFEILSTADESKDVSIRLFEGMTIDSTFVPGKTKMNNLIGKEVYVPGKIKPKVNVTRYYTNNLNK